MGTRLPGADRKRRHPRARLTWTVFAGVALGTTSLYAAFTAAPLIATDIGASRAWSGVPGAASVLGTALGSSLLSWVMARRGRRRGLQLGWIVGVAGAVAATVAVDVGAFAPMVVAMLLIGIGHASNQLSRFAAADMHPAEARPSVLASVVWAGTIGAALGPSLLGAGEVGADALGMSSATSGFLVAALFYGLAAACGATLRPDPREISDDDTISSGTSLGLSSLWSLGHVQIAVIVMILGQVAMVLIMTMTPLHIREHGHGLGTVGFVMSAHLVGMFALAPPVGRLVRRIGSVNVALVGMGLLVAGALGAAATPAEHGLVMAACLFLLGLGWCFGFVAGSALLTLGLAYAERIQMQGRVDALVWTFSALASFGSGILLETFGFRRLSRLGAAVVVGSLFLVARRRARAESTVPWGPAARSP